MKISSSTLLMIIAILFALICGLAYFFYSKHKSMMKHINNQFTNYNYNIQNQMVDLLDQYKNFVSQNKPIVQSREEEQKINDFIADLEKVDEQDIELEKEIQSIVHDTELEAEINQNNHLPTIQEEDLDEATKELDELPTIDDDEDSVEDIDDEDSTSESEEDKVEEVEEVEEVESEEDLNLQMSDDEDAFDFEVDSNNDNKEIVPFEMLEEEPEEKKETTPVELPPRCSFHFKRGKNKGTQCDRPAREDGKCTKHTGK